MHGCQECRERLLDHLYDLLDGEEARTLSDHLAGCSACQAALETARAQQKLLAAAARAHFPEVRFTPPSDDQITTPAGVRPVLLAEKPKVNRPVRWRRWAVAAALLLAVAGVGIPAALLGSDYSAAARAVSEQENALADARGEIAHAKEELLAAARHRDERIDGVRQSARARELRMEVQGPQAIVAGAAAEFIVRTYDLNNRPAPADVSATLDLARRTEAAKDDKKSEDKKDSAKPATGALRESRTAAPTVRELGVGVYQLTVPASANVDAGRAVAMNVSARRKDDPRLLSLGGTLRLNAPVYLTHLATDKPMYQPGETLRFRSLTVERASMRPAAEDFRFVYTLAAPNGAVVASLRGANALLTQQGREVSGPDGKPLRGVGTGEFSLAGLSGGEYTLGVSEEHGRFTAATRRFTINEYQKPRMDKKLDFNKPSYGSGDQVAALLTVHSADTKKPVADRPAEATVNVDGYLVGGKISLRTGPDGSVVVKFRLPEKIDRGQASLSVAVRDGATEAITRTIPVVLNKVTVEFFPEGGDLIAGLSNRVYFQARTPLGKPAQVGGTLLEDGHPIAAGIETLSDDRQPGVNQGNGAFTFMPRVGHEYRFRIDSPAGIKDQVTLPTAREDGVVLNVPGGVYEADEPIRAVVHSTKPRTLIVGAYCRGRLIDTVRLEKGQTEAVLKPGSGGVCRVTVFEEQPGGGAQRDLRPLAERLVYRQPKERIDLAMTTDHRSYTPGQKVNLSLIAVDEREKVAPAVVMIAVVEKSVVTLADQKTDRAMPTHLLLTTEVRRADDLEYADFLVGQHPKAPQALDLLLGTQGWRRFAEQSPDQWRAALAKKTRNMSPAEKMQRQEEAERLLVLTGQSTPKTTDFDQEQIDRAISEFQDEAAQAQAKHDDAAAALTAGSHEAAYRAAQQKLAAYRDQAGRMREAAVPVLGAVLCLLVLIAAAQLAGRHAGRVLIAGAAAGARAVVLVVLWRSPLAPKMATHDNRAVAMLDAPQARHERVWEEEDAKNAVKADEGLAQKQQMGGPVPPAMAPLAGGAPMPGGPRDMFHPFAKGDQKQFEAEKAPAKAAGMGPAGDALRLDEANKFRGRVMPAAPRAKDAKDRNGNRFMFERGGGFGKGGGIGGGGFGGGRGKAGEGKAEQPMMMMPPPAPMPVREYRHAYAAPEDGVRRDFAETVYWHPALVLPDGRAEVSFELCDSVTTFEAVAFTHTLDGRLGVATKKIETRLPFTLAPKLPAEVTATDHIDVPVSVSNNTPDAQRVEVTLAAHDGLNVVEGNNSRGLSLQGEQRSRAVFSLRPSLVEGKARVRFSGKCGPFADAVEESIRVVPDGFPITGSSSDVLEGSATHKVKLPKWLDGTLKVRVDAYPSTMADLQKGLEGLLREPHGCFEQSSTANYPNVLILDYLKTADKADPQTEKRARELIGRGYQKLTSFECQDGSKRRGYEWFGGPAPAHEALTAYGLLQFTDMSKVAEVDAAMLKRTKDYLLSRRGKDGSFERNPRAIDTFGRAPAHVTDAYITWALSEIDGETDLTKEFDALRAKAKGSNSAYFLSLVALGLRNRGQTAEAKALLETVAKQQKGDGHLEGGDASITGSGGVALQIEATALAVLGWLKTDAVAFDRNIRSAVKWIGQQRGGGGAFGSTQSTILALKALIAHAKANKRTPEAGELRLFVGETKVAELSFPAGVDRPLSLELPDAAKHLKPGENKLRVEVTGAKNVFPHTLSWEYRSAKPDSAANAPVKLKTTLARTNLTEGEAVRLTVRVENASGTGQGMAVAVVGLPAGLSLPEDLKQLKEYMRLPEDGKRPLLSAFEVKGREVVLYWRDLAKGQAIEVPLDVVARVPGGYRGPASRAYLYYNAEAKDWAEPLAVTVAAR